MAESRSKSLPLGKILATYWQPDTGKTVTLRDSGGTILVTATESPASSGNYIATWNPASVGPKFGYWYVNGVLLSGSEEIWMGLKQGRSTRIFYNVTVYDSAASPTGAVGSAKTWTTGSGSLATDSDGRTDFNFVNPPLIFFVDKQTRRTTLSGLATVSSGNVSFSTVMSEDGSNYDSTTCKADILIVSRD